MESVQRAYAMERERTRERIVAVIRLVYSTPLRGHERLLFAQVLLMAAQDSPRMGVEVDQLDELARAMEYPAERVQMPRAR